MKFFLPIAWLVLCLGVSTAMAANPAGELRVDDRVISCDTVRLKFAGTVAHEKGVAFKIFDGKSNEYVECRIGDKVREYVVDSMKEGGNVLVLQTPSGTKISLIAESQRTEPFLALISTDGKTRFFLKRGEIFKFRLHAYQVINYDWPKSARILDTASQQEFVLTPQGPPAAEGK